MLSSISSSLASFVILLLNVRTTTTGPLITSSRLSFNNRPICIRFPLTLIYILNFLPPVPRHDTQPTPFLHPCKMLLCFLHISIDIIQSRFYSVQLFSLVLQHFNCLSSSRLTFFHHLNHSSGALQ